MKLAHRLHAHRDNQPTFGRLRSLLLPSLKRMSQSFCVSFHLTFPNYHSRKCIRDRLNSEGLPPKLPRNPGCRVWAEQKWKLSSRTVLMLNAQPFDLCVWFIWGRCKHPNLNTPSLPTALQTWREQNPWGIYSSYIYHFYLTLYHLKRGYWLEKKGR